MQVEIFPNGDKFYYSPKGERIALTGMCVSVSVTGMCVSVSVTGVCVCVHVCVCVCERERERKREREKEDLCVFTCVCVRCICVYACVFVCEYIYTHIPKNFQKVTTNLSSLPANKQVQRIDMQQLSLHPPVAVNCAQLNFNFVMGKGLFYNHIYQYTCIHI